MAQSRAAGSELLNAVFCSKARSAAMSDVSAEGAKMVGVGRGMSQQSFNSHIHGEGVPLFKKTLMRKQSDLYFNSQLI